jgi:hypothetical protein
MTLQLRKRNNEGEREFIIDDTTLITLPYHYDKDTVYSIKVALENIKSLIDASIPTSKKYNIIFSSNELIVTIVVWDNNFKYSSFISGGIHISFTVEYTKNKAVIEEYLKYLLEIKDTEPVKTFDDLLALCHKKK